MRLHMKSLLTHGCARAGLLASLLFLAGCASFSADRGLIAVNDITGPALGQDAIALRTPEDAESARAKVKALLGRPLSADRAAQIALLNNRDLQAAYNALGLAEAAMVQGSLPPNPTFSFERIAGAGAVEIEGRIVGSLLTLATLPMRAEVAAGRFRQAQFQAASDTLRIASDARRAFYRAVAAHALASFLMQARETGETAAQLADRLGETGAMNKLDQARNQAFYAELVAQLATARKRATSERERLVRALGLWGGDLDFKLPAQLPPLPARARSLASVEVEAVRRRVDLQMARIEAELLAKSYGLTGATRFISLLDVAGISKKAREDGEIKRESGFEIEFQVPIFDFGEVKVRQAEESYLQAVNRLTAKAVNVRSEAREAYQAYRASYDLARHYRREVMPLRKIISDQTLLRYNAMQIDVFSLLTESRQGITSSIAVIDAEREFWLAESNLRSALIGGNAGGASPESTSSTAAAPESAGGH
jgi:outer membrane protein TolC